MSHLVYEAVQIAGSLLILLAFGAGLAGRLDQTGYRYLVLNAVGSAALAATAVISLEWGFILLEGAWATVSVVSIVRKASGAGVSVAQ
jgi:hypothetical protein